MRKKHIMFFIVLIMIIMFPNLSLGIAFKTNCDKDYIESGEETKIIVSVNDIDVKNGINSIQGKINYNKNDWDKITVNDIQGKNNWSISYNENGQDEGNFILIKLDSGETKNQELFEITLRAKNRINECKSEIKLTDLYTTDGEKMIPINDVYQVISIKSNMYLIMEWILIAICIVGIIIFLIVIKNKKSKKNIID